MKRIHQHSIDFLFSIAIFFVFSATAVLVLILSSNIYKTVVANSDHNFEIGTSISYITEKIRQNDNSETQDIYLCEFDSCEALAISQNYNDINYITYIYEHEGFLKESFIQEGVSASANSGTSIMEIGQIEFSQTNDNLLCVTCTSKTGQIATSFISIHSSTN